MLEEIIETDESSLVFTQYTSMGRILKEYIQSSLGCETFFLHGGIPRKERDAVIKKFQEDSSSGDNKKSSRVFVPFYKRWWCRTKSDGSKPCISL